MNECRYEVSPKCIVSKLVFVSSIELATSFSKRISCNIDVLGVYSSDSVNKNQSTLKSINCNQLAEIIKDHNVYFAVDNEKSKIEILEKGVSKGQVVDISKFADTIYDNPTEGLSSDYDGLLMGMSHSQCAINTAAFRKINIFKMSAPSMDMFLHFHFLKKLVIESPDRISNITNVIIELPYYIFNYDLSRFGDFVYTKMKYFSLVGDYHNLRNVEDVEEYNLFMRLFDAPITESKRISPLKTFLKKIGLYELRTCFRAITNRDKVWTSYYENTIKENISYWNKIRTLLRNHLPHAKITVLVMPMNSLFRLTHIKSIATHKKLFYSQMEGVHLVDDFDYLKNPFLYSDHCHLNKKGSDYYNDHLVKIENVLFQLK